MSLLLCFAVYASLEIRLDKTEEQKGLYKLEAGLLHWVITSKVLANSSDHVHLGSLHGGLTSCKSMCF